MKSQPSQKAATALNQRNKAPKMGAPVETGAMPRRLALWVSAIALLGVVVLYWPSVHGPFIFDDSELPLYSWARARPFLSWISGVRPVTMLSYWLNRTLWGDDPFSYHAVNMALHAINTVLVFLVVWQLLGWRDWDLAARRRAALF